MSSECNTGKPFRNIGIAGLFGYSVTLCVPSGAGARQQGSAMNRWSYGADKSFFLSKPSWSFLHAFYVSFVTVWLQSSLAGYRVFVIARLSTCLWPPMPMRRFG